MLAVCELFRAQILPVVHQEIKGVEAGLTAMKEQVTELGPSLLVEAYNFAVQYRFPQSVARVTWKVLKKS